MQVEFVAKISHGPLDTKCFTFSETIYELCLQFAMLRNFVSSITYGY